MVTGYLYVFLDIQLKKCLMNVNSKNMSIQLRDILYLFTPVKKSYLLLLMRIFLNTMSITSLRHCETFLKKQVDGYYIGRDIV